MQEIKENKKSKVSVVPVSAQSCITSAAVLFRDKATESAQKSLASVSREDITSL